MIIARTPGTSLPLLGVGVKVAAEAVTGTQAFAAVEGGGPVTVSLGGVASGGVVAIPKAS